jgi:hypothetical protein
VLRELKWKSPSGIDQGTWFDYRNNFLFHYSPSDMSNFLLPLLAIATIAMAVPATLLLFRKDRRTVAPGVTALLGLIMSLSLSKPIWDRFPILQETQFPWRWMTITSACVALLAALAFSEMHSMWRTRMRPLCLALAGLVLVAISFTVLQLMRGAILSDRVTFDQKIELLEGSTTNQDFLPVWAKEPVRHMSSVVEAPNRTVTVLQWSAERKVFSVEPGPQTDIRLKTYYYPYWMAVANAQRLITTPANDGALLVRVPPEKTTVTVTFVEPPIAYIAGLISVLSLLIIVVLLILPRALTLIGERRALVRSF